MTRIGANTATAIPCTEITAEILFRENGEREPHLGLSIWDMNKGNSEVELFLFFSDKLVYVLSVCKGLQIALNLSFGTTEKHLMLICI